MGENRFKVQFSARCSVATFTVKLGTCTPQNSAHISVFGDNRWGKSQNFA